MGRAMPATGSGTDEGRFVGACGVPIHWERAEPAGTPRGVVLLSHGYAEHIGRYRDFVAHLTARGLAVGGIDHRGHGRSGGPRGHCRDPLTARHFDHACAVLGYTELSCAGSPAGRLFSL